MTEEIENELEQALHHRVDQLNARLQGIVLGLLLGVGFFIATVFLLIKGGDPVGPHLSLLGFYFPGYHVTWLGAFIGLGYGFLVGFILGYLTAIIYNQLLRLRKHPANKGH